MSSTYDKILEELLNLIETKEEKEKIERLKFEIKDQSMEGMKREMIFQILARESEDVRNSFFAEHPELTVLYRSRIK